MRPEPLTPEEIRAIKALKRVAKIWPKSLWLFADGTLNVMKKHDGKTVVKSGRNGESVNPFFCVDQIDIENDGGGW